MTVIETFCQTKFDFKEFKNELIQYEFKPIECLKLHSVMSSWKSDAVTANETKASVVSHNSAQSSLTTPSTLIPNQTESNASMATRLLPSVDPPVEEAKSDISVGIENEGDEADEEDRDAFSVKITVTPRRKRKKEIVDDYDAVEEHAPAMRQTSRSGRQVGKVLCATSADHLDEATATNACYDCGLVKVCGNCYGKKIVCRQCEAMVFDAEEQILL
jgi:hypothetical protein